MSADNWSNCPNCEKLGNDVSDTLREDYEFFLEDGILDISYSCSCRECGFVFNYNKEIDIMDCDDHSEDI